MVILIQVYIIWRIVTFYAFKQKLSYYLIMKVLDMLCLAYINNDKVDTAFILVNCNKFKKNFYLRIKINLILLY